MMWGLAGAVIGASIVFLGALVVRFIASADFSEDMETPCAGCRGRHVRADHQVADPDGACFHVGCRCSRFRP